MDGGRKERTEQEEDDFFNVTIQQSGCSTEHHALQDCFAVTGDWRQCRTEMAQFKTCMDKQRQAKHDPNTVK